MYSHMLLSMMLTFSYEPQISRRRGFLGMIMLLTKLVLIFPSTVYLHEAILRRTAIIRNYQSSINIYVLKYLSITLSRENRMSTIYLYAFLDSKSLITYTKTSSLISLLTSFQWRKSNISIISDGA